MCTHIGQGYNAMTTDKQLADAIRARVAEIDKERDHLVALLEHYGTIGPKERQPASPTASQATFENRPSGLTERLLQVIKDRPGLKYSEVLDGAEKGLVTNSTKPRRSLGSTLGSQVKKGKILKRDGRYYPVTE